MRNTAINSLRSFDAYWNMTETSNGANKSQHENFRLQYFEYCGITKNPYNTTKSLARCVLTGRSGEGRKETLKLAHLIPVSTSEEIRSTLNISNDQNGIWSFRNCLLLCWNIEYYYDRKKLSFVPHPLQNNTYMLKIWDATIRNEPIYEGAVDENESGDSTIGYYENCCLKLQMENGIKLVPFKRCLSNQMFVCFASTKLSNQFVPPGFSSDTDRQKCSFKRDDLLVLRKGLQKVIMEESLEEHGELIDDV